MSKVALITDSACDLTPEELARQRVAMVPLTVSLGQSNYKDGVDLSREEFYRLLAQHADHAHTAQPSPGAFAEAYRAALSEADQVLVITLSSGLSGTYDAALLAEQETGIDAKRVTVFDSRSASVGQALMVVGAAERAAAGKSVEEILSFLDDLRTRLASLFTLDTLEYLVRGGRLSRVQGMMGSLLHIKPILELDGEGKIVPREKQRGRGKAIERLVEIIGAEGRALAGQRIGISHARTIDEAQALAARLREEFKVGEVLMGEIGATIGTHTGPGCLAVFFSK